MTPNDLSFNARQISKDGIKHAQLLGGCLTRRPQLLLRRVGASMCHRRRG